MDPTWPALKDIIEQQGSDAIVKVEPKTVAGAGRGLFARENIEPLQTLVSIPGHLLLNAKTLSKEYPSRLVPPLSITVPNFGAKHSRLTSIQLLSLHLYRWRRGVIDSKFNTYLKSLPVSFFDHPLTVIITSNRRTSIIESLPPSVAIILIAVEKRMKEDWDIATKCFKDFPSLIPPLDKEISIESYSKLAEFTWAWLNVNTRCLYHTLGFVQPEDNITMCPLLDFANHTPLQSKSITQDEFALCDGMAFSSSVNLQPGDEVYLRYGGHSNTVLFAEYGFVLPHVKEAHTLSSEILIDGYVEEMLQSYPNYAERSQLLRDRNYWGDWTLHIEDGVGRPSYRLLPALRLLHVSLEPTTPNQNLELWENMLLGLTEVVSVENEHRARSSVAELCEQIIRKSDLGIPVVQSRIVAEGVMENEDEGCLQVLRMAVALWEEKREVAALVQKAVADGVEF